MAKHILIGTSSKVVHIQDGKYSECGKGQHRGFTPTEAAASCKVCIKKAAYKAGK